MLQPLNLIGKGFGWELAPQANAWGATQLILRRPVDRVVDMNDYSNDRWGKQETIEADMSRKTAKALNVEYVDLKSYPYNEIVKEFKTDYFSNTIDFMMALAIYEGYQEINLYGVNMAHETEYAYQKAGVDFWCGMAMGRGIKVNVFGEDSRIMKSPDDLVYGYYTRRGVMFDLVHASPNLIAETKREIASLEKMLRDDKSSGRNKIQDESLFREEIRNKEAIIKDHAPKKLTDAQSNKALAMAKKLEEKIRKKMPSNKSFYRFYPKAGDQEADFETSVREQMAFMTDVKLQSDIREYKYLMQNIDPDDPRVSDIEKLRAGKNIRIRR